MTDDDLDFLVSICAEQVEQTPYGPAVPIKWHLVGRAIDELKALRVERDELLKGLENLGWPCQLVELPEEYNKLAVETLRLRAENAETMSNAIKLAASFAAAVSLLERGGKKAAPSDKMFAQMLLDYKGSLDGFRAYHKRLRDEGE